VYESSSLAGGHAFAWGSVVAIVIVLVIAAVAIVLARTVFRTDRAKDEPYAAESFLQRIMDDPDSLDKK